jgi:N-methylhydantoinase A
VAICFLHSFANPEHEHAARHALAAFPLRVALSSEVAPEIREFERTSTTVASVFVQGRVADYLDDIESRLEPPLRVMLSTAGSRRPRPPRPRRSGMLESGPAAGALAAARFGAQAGHEDLMSFDMGGTTAKLCLIEDGRPLITHEFEVARTHRFKKGSGLPIKTPTIDMIEIGVGGGSIARVNALGLLTCGPDSAGADPGPACYGLGGTQPTVTDADLVLGYLDPGFFLGGTMALDPEAAGAALTTLGERLGLSVSEAAWGHPPARQRGHGERRARARRRAWPRPDRAAAVSPSAGGPGPRAGSRGRWARARARATGGGRDEQRRRAGRAARGRPRALAARA